MLKIKDNVDLKELEKFGFEYTNNDMPHAKKSIEIDYQRTIVIHINNNKEIWFRVGCKSYCCSSSFLYTQKELGFFKTRYYLRDLIKNRLVEKVKE